MSITRKLFGKTLEGKTADIFTLENSKKVTVQITNYGGTVVSIKVPDRNGKLEDVVLGYDKLSDYFNQDMFIGAIVGRHANRIENSTIEINGIEYKLTKNEGENQLHGGLKGFDKVLWDAVVSEEEENTLELTYLSPDLEEGFPGNLKVKVTYTLTEDNELKIGYLATSDKDTVVNLTNHSYFNLQGQGSGDILKNQVYINADSFTVNDIRSLPTGEIRKVSGTPMDFTKMKEVGKDIHAEYDQLIFGNGYDHNFVINDYDKSLQRAAEVYEEISGRVLEVYTTMPGVQLYTGNYVHPGFGKNNATYGALCALCLETQYFPNSLKHKNFPSPILKAKEEYNQTTVYKFSVR